MGPRGLLGGALDWSAGGCSSNWAGKVNTYLEWLQCEIPCLSVDECFTSLIGLFVFFFEQ